MKKLVILVAAVGIGFSSWAQKKNVGTAQAALTREDYSRAKSAIDEAIEDPSTKDDPRTWFIRGDIYSALQNQPAFSAYSPLAVAANSYIKVAELDPNFRKDEVNTRLLNMAQVFYNLGLEQ